MATQSPGKGRALSDVIAAHGLARIMAAHSPLSARLAEEAGFDGLWASGFELSALYGLPDVSLISMSQHLDMVRAMAEAVSIPVVADIDTLVARLADAARLGDRDAIGALFGEAIAGFTPNGRTAH